MIERELISNQNNSNLYDSPVRIAIVHGEKKHYYSCSKKRNAYPNFPYLGYGVIYSVDGVIQSGSEKYHFGGYPE